MAQRSRFPVRHQTRSKRTTGWGFGPDMSNASIAANGKTLWTNSVALSGFDEVTLVRVRGVFAAYLQLATAVGDGFRCAIGIGLTTVQAHAAGAASLPGPLSELDSEIWLYHRLQ